MIRKILLGGASCLAILGAAGEASAISFVDTTPGVSSFTAPTTGSYTISVWGAQGGAGYAGSGVSGATYAGGLGYGQRTVFQLTAGQTVALYVGAKGGDAILGNPAHIGGGGGGGGASAVVLNPGLGIFAGGVVSGGGGGGSKYNAGYNGQGVSPGGAGGAGGGHVGGQGGQFGSSGGYSPGLGGGPGGGLRTYTPTGPYAGRGHDDGGAGGLGFGVNGSGGSGFAGGGGSVILGGGGGGGYSGGGGSGAGGTGATGADRYGGGGGGGSYSFGGTGRTALAYKAGDGEIEISSVPEPSSWAMMLGGFGFTGYVLRRRVTRRRVMRTA
jgi:PEP-CTERM motif